ncbi:MAG: CrcB family protein [Kiritimatiellia bacterium]
MNSALLTLSIAGAGAVGAVLRWGAVHAVLSMGLHFTFATLTVNVLGSFAAGLLFALLREAHPLLLATIFIGFLGAFTTFSTYTLESVRLLFDGEILRGVLNIMLQNGLGLIAAISGLLLGRALS